MFERFSQEARRAVIEAANQARSLGSDCVSAEHLLLGLLNSDGIAAKVLDSVRPEGGGAWLDPDSRSVSGEESPNYLPFTPRVKRALELSMREAVVARSHYIGTQHVLLGLIRSFGS